MEGLSWKHCTCAKSACDCLANEFKCIMCRLPDCDNHEDHPESEDELYYEEPDEDLCIRHLLTKYTITA